MLNKSRILLGVMVLTVMFGAVAFFSSAKTASADCTITATLRVGSSGSEVSCLQTKVGATADGSFGPLTKASVMAYQSNHGLSADGVVGPLSRAVLNASVSPAAVTFAPTGCTSAGGYSPLLGLAGGLCHVAGTPATGCQTGYLFDPMTGASCTGAPAPAPSPETLTGGAGSLDYTPTSTGVKNDVKEDGSENVVAIQLEASGSDIAVTNVKFTIVDSTGAGSTHPESYMDSFDVLLGTTKVGSIDAGDLSRAGSIYTGNVSLSNAVVQMGTSHKAKLYIRANTLSTVDNTANTFTIDITQIRWKDATGAMFSDTVSESNTFGFNDASSDDSIAIKSSSTKPDAGNILVDANSTSSEQLISAFKLDVGVNSSDMTIFELPITLNFTASGATTADAPADSSETIVDSVRIKVGSEWHTADFTSESVTNGAGTAVYTVTDEFTINAGEAPVVGVYATFNEQDGNYGVGEKVSADVIGSTIDAEGKDSITVTGSSLGNDQTLSLVGNSVSSISWVKNGGGTSTGSLDFMFTVTADGGDIALAIADITGVDTPTAVGGSVTITTPVLLKISGTATGTTNAYTVEDGNTANFRVRYAVTGAGGSAEVTLPSIAGEAVPDSKQLSPTIYID